MAERLFTTYQIAELLGQTPGTVVEWIQKGWLPVRRLPDGAVRVPGRGLVAFIKERGVNIEEVLAVAFVNDGKRQAREGASERDEQSRPVARAAAPESLVTPEEVAALLGDAPIDAPPAPSEIPESEIPQSEVSAPDDAGVVEGAAVEDNPQGQQEEPEAELVGPSERPAKTPGAPANAAEQLAEAILADAAASGAD